MPLTARRGSARALQPLHSAQGTAFITMSHQSRAPRGHVQVDSSPSAVRDVVRPHRHHAHAQHRPQLSRPEGTCGVCGGVCVCFGVCVCARVRASMCTGVCVCARAYVLVCGVHIQYSTLMPSSACNSGTICDILLRLVFYFGGRPCVFFLRSSVRSSCVSCPFEVLCELSSQEANVP